MVRLLALTSSLAMLATCATALIEITLPSMFCYGVPALISWTGGENGGDFRVQVVEGNDYYLTIGNVPEGENSFLWTVDKPVTGYDDLWIYVVNNNEGGNSVGYFAVPPAESCAVPTSAVTSASAAATATDDAPPPSCPVETN